MKAFNKWQRSAGCHKSRLTTSLHMTMVWSWCCSATVPFPIPMGRLFCCVASDLSAERSWNRGKADRRGQTVNKGAPYLSSGIGFRESKDINSRCKWYLLIVSLQSLLWISIEICSPILSFYLLKDTNYLDNGVICRFHEQDNTRETWGTQGFCTREQWPVFQPTLVGCCSPTSSSSAQWLSSAAYRPITWSLLTLIPIFSP